MKSPRISVLLITVCFLLSQAMPLIAAEKYNWAQKLIMPIENTGVHHNETFNFGRYKFAHSPVKDGKIKSVITLEGKKSSILYKATEKNSTFEVFSVYKKLLKDKGFEIVFKCEKGACGGGFHKVWYDLNPFESNPGWNNSAPITQGGGNYYIAAKKKISGNNTYVSILTNSGWWNHPVYRVDVAQISSLDTKVIPASKIKETIMSEGRAVFYGINFDSGKSDIKKESEPTLSEIAVFLKKSKGLFYVVGHTDDQGALSNNMNLSETRAKSISDFLVKKHGVPANKLTARGAGPLAPVASNLNDKGRALNRRVEIVKKFESRSKSSISDIPDFELKLDAALATNGATDVQETSSQQVQTVAQPEPPKEENLIPVPKVTGKLYFSGKKILTKQGFKVKRAGKRVGFIRKQNPSANTKVKKGTTITLTVGR